METMETFSIVKKVCTVYTKQISQKNSMVLRLHTFYDPNKIDTATCQPWNVVKNMKIGLKRVAIGAFGASPIPKCTVFRA